MNIIHLDERARKAMQLPEKFPKDEISPVNADVSQAKVILFCNVVSASDPEIRRKDEIMVAQTAAHATTVYLLGFNIKTWALEKTQKSEFGR